MAMDFLILMFLLFRFWPSKAKARDLENPLERFNSERHERLCAGTMELCEQRCKLRKTNPAEGEQLMEQINQFIEFQEAHRDELYAQERQLREIKARFNMPLNVSARSVKQMRKCCGGIS